MEKKFEIQNCLARCQAVPAVKKALKSTENLTGGVSIAMSIVQVGTHIADVLAVASYMTHLLQLCCDRNAKPKSWVDWVQEMILLFCAIVSLMSLCSMCLPAMLVKITTVLSLTLFSAAWQPTLPF